MFDYSVNIKLGWFLGQGGPVLPGYRVKYDRVVVSDRRTRLYMIVLCVHRSSKGIIRSSTLYSAVPYVFIYFSYVLYSIIQYHPIVIIGYILHVGSNYNNYITSSSYTEYYLESGILPDSRRNISYAILTFKYQANSNP